ncbi:MAG: hypothetical protein ACYDCI_00035 [Candidatus Limnocylindrales bacterium]
MNRESIWLWDVRHRVSIQEIATREDLSPRRIRLGIGRARASDIAIKGDTAALRPPLLVPLFPITTFTPLSTCAHLGPIPEGSVFCCMICHRSGVDDHPGLQRDPATEPKPEPKPAAPCTTGAKKPKKETRRDRRRRMFGVASAETGAAKLTAGEATTAYDPA